VAGLRRSGARRDGHPGRYVGAQLRILVVNAGSSSVKLTLLDHGDKLLAEHDIGALGAETMLRELASTVASLPEPDAVGHRIVHGGERFRDAVLIDDRVEGALRELSDLAPLHQAKSLAALDAVKRALPDTPAVACFDTAFHAAMPPAARTYALPADWRRRWPLRRYGFHGLSHAYASRRAAELIGHGSLRVITCHLGAGASLAAVRDGRSCDTTMGFTPLEGLVMATRSGSVDPGLVLWLLEHAQLAEHELAHALEHDSGLLALAGTSDMREALRRRDEGDEQARLALEVYLHRLRAGIAAMAAALGGFDVLVFTGGVGERSAPVREGACVGLEFLGVALDPAANAEGDGDRDVGLPGAAPRVLVIAAREDLEIARQVRELFATSHRSRDRVADPAERATTADG
jgi:acetate kinase